MPLKKPAEPLSLFSMSSMTDIIFLLLIFFMVTSSLITPTAIDVTLPESAVQVNRRPVTEVYLDSTLRISIIEDRNDSVNMEKSFPRAVSLEELGTRLGEMHTADSLLTVALFAHSSVEYGKVVEILDVAARNHIKMVLATRARENK